MNWRRATLAIATLVWMVGPGSTVSQAAPPVRCVVIQSIARCVVIAIMPGSGGGGGGGGTGGDPVCTYAGRPIACTLGDAYWNGDRECYITTTDPQPPPGHPLWRGHYPDGAIYHCKPPTLAPNPLEFDFWSASPPAGPSAPPDPLVLAIQAVESMSLRAGDIGSTPGDTPGLIGIVGFPQWLWIADPGPTTTGPISRSASAGLYTVTATARLEKTFWDMGDGDGVTCTKPGTKWSPEWGKRTSPDCGYAYTHDGYYTVTARGQWRIDWAGMGTSGAFTFELPRSTQLVMGEVQVIVTG